MSPRASVSPKVSGTGEAHPVALGLPPFWNLSGGAGGGRRRLATHSRAGSVAGLAHAAATRHDHSERPVLDALSPVEACELRLAKRGPAERDDPVHTRALPKRTQRRRRAGWTPWAISFRGGSFSVAIYGLSAAASSAASSYSSWRPNHIPGLRPRAGREPSDASPSSRPSGALSSSG
jgi:hypothetical protein